MTPTSSGKRQSGNPATQAAIDLTVKQQREQQKQQKLAEYERGLARRRRSRLTWWIVGSTAALVVIGLVAASIIFAPKPATYDAGGTGAEIEGVETFTNETKHVEGTVDYPQNPPAGGPHNQYWLNCSVYDQPQQNENAVHSLEHGAIWVTYRPDLPADQVAALRDAVRGEPYGLLSPFPDLPDPVVATVWGTQLRLQSAGAPELASFIAKYADAASAPEPRGACTGGIGTPLR